jgi:hypothetical protein
MSGTETKIQAAAVERYRTVGALRTALTYKSREAMQRQWEATFAGQMLPAEHEAVDAEEAIRFIEELTVTKRGRPGSITAAAQKLKRELSCSAEGLKKVGNGIAHLKNGKAVAVSHNANFSETSEISGGNLACVETSFLSRVESLAARITKLDVVYFFTIAVADYGLTYLLKEMGAVAAVVYTLISLDALGMAKNRYRQQTARNGILAVWALEIGAFFIHLTMFNRRLWDAVADLPFRVEDVAAEQRPFWIAFVLAFLLSFAGIYAVSITLSKVLEQTEAENFEREHGTKY